MNNDLLEDIQCPPCHSYGPFAIIGTAEFVVYDDRIESFDSAEWKDFNDCMCLNCKFKGTVRSFQDGVEKCPRCGAPEVEADRTAGYDSAGVWRSTYCYECSTTNHVGISIDQSVECLERQIKQKDVLIRKLTNNCNR